MLLQFITWSICEKKTLSTQLSAIAEVEEKNIWKHNNICKVKIYSNTFAHWVSADDIYEQNS